MITLPILEPGSPEWYEQRRRKVGGSEIAAVLGLSKWHSRFSLWHQKAHGFAGQEDRPELEWGRRLEDSIARKFADEHSDVEIFPTLCVQPDDRPYQLATPDRLISIAGIHEQEILEVKTQRDQEGWGEPGTDEIPVYYRCQAIWNLDALGLEWCKFAVLIGGSDYREYTVRYDEADALRMREAAQEFIATIDAGERPPIDEHSATYQTVRAMHPEIEPVDVELPAALARAFCTAKHAATAATDEAQRQTSLVADYIGNAQRAVFLGATIARRQSKGGATPYLVAGRNLPEFTESETAA